MKGAQLGAFVVDHRASDRQQALAGLDEPDDPPPARPISAQAQGDVPNAPHAEALILVALGGVGMIVAVRPHDNMADTTRRIDHRGGLRINADRTDVTKQHQGRRV